MLNLIDKLINERGSANIMKDRLGLKDDELAAMQRELSSVIDSYSNLESENKQLKISLDTAHQEVDRLNEIIKASTESQSNEKLDEVKENILKTFFNVNGHAGIAHLSSHLSIDKGLVQYHIDILKENKLIDLGPLMINSPATYKLSKAGRKYVVEVIGL